MAQRTWMLGLWLGFVGFSIATGCVVKSDDDDGTDDDAAAGGEDSGGGGTGNRGGTGGNTGGSSGNTGGTGGNTGGTGGATGGTGGMTGGTSGTGGDEYECDPNDGSELVNTPYPDCAPRDATDDCEVCIQENCCEESRICFGFNPGNVCGSGGPTTGPYAGNSEFDCYRFCAEDYVMENGVYDEGANDECTGACVTDDCPGVIVGNATQDIIICMDANCEDECYTPE